MTLNFSKIKISDRSQFKIKITPQLHRQFTQLSKDKSPIHTNAKFCHQTKFKKPIGYAFLLESLLSRLYGEYLPGGTSICLKQESKFIHPFFVGDTITVKAQVIRKSSGTKIVEIETKMFNQKNQQIYQGTGLVQVIFSQLKS